MKIIDHSEEIRSIKNQFGDRYYFEPSCTRQLGELWGVESNEHGAITHHTKEVFAEIGNYYHASMVYVETSKGYFLAGTDFGTSVSGGGNWPSVYDNIGYLSYQDARTAAIHYLIERFQREVESPNSCGGKSHLERCRQMVEKLEAAKNQQLDLF